MTTQQETKTKDLHFTVVRQAVSYGRVSTDDQADYGTSLPDQERGNRAYGADNNIPIVAHFADDYSGLKLKRPEFDKVRQYLRDGLADCLIVSKADRLSRHRTHMLMIVDELLELGAELHIIGKGKINLADDTQVMMLSLEGHMAHQEAAKILERTHKGRIAKAVRGDFMGSKAPYGRKIVKDAETTQNGRIIVKNRRLEIEPDEAYILRLMFELYGYKDYSYDGIARHLDDSGYLFRDGKRWSSNNVHHILKQTVHAGLQSYAGNVTQIEPIVSQELWDIVKYKREHNAKHKRHATNPNRYIFTGRATCFHCGFSMVALTNSGDPGYRCNCARSYNLHYFNRTGKTCPNKHFYNARLVDGAALEWLKEIMTDRKTLEKGYQDYLTEQQTRHQPLLDDLGRIDRLIENKRGKLERLLMAFAETEGGFGEEARQILQEKSRDIEQELKTAKITKNELEQELKEFLSLPDRIQAVDNLGEMARQAFEGGISPEKFKDLVEMLDVRIKLEQAADGYFLHISSIVGPYVGGPFTSRWW